MLSSCPEEAAPSPEDRSAQTGRSGEITERPDRSSYNCGFSDIKPIPLLVENSLNLIECIGVKVTELFFDGAFNVDHLKPVDAIFLKFENGAADFVEEVDLSVHA